MDGGTPDRVPIHDGYWDEALDRWQKEGLSREIASDRHALGEYFDTEIRTISVDSSFQFEERIIDEDERYITKVTKNGTVVKFIKGKTSTPGLISFPAGSREEWEKLKGRLRSVEGRLPDNLGEKYRAYVEKQRYVVLCVHDPYEASWSKLGPTYLLESMKTDPDFARDVFKTINDLNLAVCEHFFGLGYEIDAGWIWGDIAYCRGTFFSPQMYRDILYPLHRRLIGFFVDRGLPVVYHSDGDIRQVLPLLVEAGVRCIQPLEAKANMNLFDLKRDYGDKLVFMGNVDFDKIAMGPREAEEEIRTKVGMGKEGGGYVYHSDHSVPPTVSLEEYKRVLKMVKSYGTY
jgi:uroporphyrinogen decarboxylase